MWEPTPHARCIKPAGGGVVSPVTLSQTGSIIRVVGVELGRPARMLLHFPSKPSGVRATSRGSWGPSARADAATSHPQLRIVLRVCSPGGRRPGRSLAK